MAKVTGRKRLPRKGADAVRFIEDNSEVAEKRQEGSHVFMRIHGPQGEAVVVVNVHGNRELSTGVWHKINKQLIRVGVLSMLVIAMVVWGFMLTLL